MTTIHRLPPYDVLDDPGPEAYEALLREAPITGRCPVWVTPQTAERLDLFDRRPGLGGIDDLRRRRLLEVARLDPEAVLAGRWRGPYPPACRPEPLPAWPGLARRPVRDRTAAAVTEAGSWTRDLLDLADLAVVDAARPADVPAAVGWLGGADHEQPATEISAVLRTWEERFGAMLVLMNAATLWVAVAEPPTSRAEAEAVAAEHFAFCPGRQDPQDGSWSGLRSYGAMIRGRDYWRFRWD